MISHGKSAASFFYIVPRDLLFDIPLAGQMLKREVKGWNKINLDDAHFVMLYSQIFRWSSIVYHGYLGDTMVQAFIVKSLLNSRENALCPPLQLFFVEVSAVVKKG